MDDARRPTDGDGGKDVEVAGAAGVPAITPADLRALAPTAVWQGRTLRWDELWELAKQLGPDPELAHLDDVGLERELRGQAAELASMTGRWLDLVGELVVRGIWADHGARTPGQWLSYMVGLGAGTAREHVRVALRLRELPRIRARLRAGTISYSKVRAITRIAVPEIEELLLRWCDHATAADIERVVSSFASYRRGLRPTPEERAARYGLTLAIEDEYTATVTLTMSVDEALQLRADAERLAALEAGAAVAADGELGTGDAAMADHGDLPPAGAPPRGQPLVAAVQQAVRAAVDHGPEDTSGADRTTLVLHAPVSALAAVVEREGDEDVVGTGVGPPLVLDDGAGRVAVLSRAVLRRLACEAGTVLVSAADDGSPLDVGRRSRLLTAQLRRAVLARDRGCRFPGCGEHRHLHVHHVRHWADGGPTDLANLLTLCATHHRFVHEHRWTIERAAAGSVRFVAPDGRALDRVPPPIAVFPEDYRLAPPATEVVFGGSSSTPAIEHLRTGPGYDPRGFDLDLAIGVLTHELARVLPGTVLAA